MNKNRGFSLIELVVALAIFAIAGIAVFGFMSYSSNNYSRTNEDVKLQYEQQLAVNQIRDAILEATNGIYYDAAEKSLVIYSQKTDTAGNVTYPVTKLSFDVASSSIYMAQKVFTTVEDIVLPAATDNRLLAENVTDFSVDLSRVKKDKVQFFMTFAAGGKEQSVNPVVALRNHLLVSDTVDSIYEKAPVEVNSFIKSIVIKRGDRDTAFTQGGTDVIKKYGESVAVQYQAIVTGTQDSTREYAVTWSTGSTNRGISVKDGLVTVEKGVLEGTLFTLTATSVEDPTKYASVQIKVEDNGVYPVSAMLQNDNAPVGGNGFRKYTMVPTLTYTDNSKSNEATLFDWKGVSSLPAGCSFNAKTGVLYLTESANGYKFDIYVVSKNNDAKGNTIISNTITIVVDKIPPYQSGPTLKLGVPSELQRGGTVTPLVSWTNNKSSNYTYYWTVTPVSDAESSWVNTSSFTECIALSSNNISQYTVKDKGITCQTTCAYRSISIQCQSKLKWKNTFKLEVSVYAQDNDGNKYYAEKQYVTIVPVELTITPTDYVLQEGAMSTEDTLYELEGGNFNMRCFMVTYKGLYVNGAYQLGRISAYGENKYLYYGPPDRTQFVKIYNHPEAVSLPDREVVGFKAKPQDWKSYPQRPVLMRYSYFVRGDYGNDVTSNILEYKIKYNN